MSRSRDIFERLMQQTVRNVLFRESSPRNQVVPVAKPAVATISATSNVHTALPTTEVRPGSLLHQLVSLDAKCIDHPAEDEEDNNVDRTRPGLWLTDCMNWSIERLKAEKAEIKRYLHEQRCSMKTCQKTTEPSAQDSIVHEVYAILKLFLLERGPDYRQCLQQSIGGNNSFLTSLHVQLTLYATYFERANGRQISKRADVKPVESLYEFFAAHHRAPNSQLTE
ncbi:hypothetical protein PR003_g3510 [Phytophthora rubi]|uniref:Uncharacterized protein n=1 Tax=Phytophthora rubi TaxID=129364 RepID=A0A6A3NB39_9STRA|nr:hypothetical protein PR001_g6102 [Phytophthora rubi]KAE9043401.1 hypothetical protein PR002_g3361 [Phytophthora rubi]KAE9354134.1 hypothetical protein PR003_g3510 [Phytophthora rubi]